MYKWITAAVVALSILTCAAVLKFGLLPKPIPIIKASNFEDPKLLGLYIYRQLFYKLTNNDVLAFGFNKENPYEQQVVDTVIENLKNLKTKMPEIISLTADESYSGSSFSKQEQIRSRYGNKALVFTLYNLKDVIPAEEIQNCEVDHTYNVWLECIKKQKVRQINKAKKVDLKKPIGIVENQSQKDILIYILE